MAGNVRGGVAYMSPTSILSQQIIIIKKTQLTRIRNHIITIN